MISIFKILAVIGLSILSWGILSKDRKKQDILFVIGGILLITYSIYIKDIIIIAVQGVFTLSALYSLIKLNKTKK